MYSTVSISFRKEVFEIKDGARLKIIEEGPLRVSAEVSLPNIDSGFQI
jgi:hypothetical protein